MHDWQDALEAARARLAEREREREDARQRAYVAELQATCPEPTVRWYLYGAETIYQADDNSVEAIYQMYDNVYSPIVRHPIREEAVRLWKTVWVQRKMRARPGRW